MFSTIVTMSQCPFCGCHECHHWIGWTEDGRTIELNRSHPAPAGHRGRFTKPLRSTDQIVTTGVSARVYRPDEEK